MEHWAWLSAVPKVPPRKGRSPSTKSRWEKMQEGGREPDFPQIDEGKYLIDFVEEISPMTDGQPTPFSEIDAWARLTGVSLTPWEAKAIRALCLAYAAAYQQAENPKMPPPFVDADAERERAAEVMKAQIEDHNRRMEMSNGSR